MLKTVPRAPIESVPNDSLNSDLRGCVRAWVNVEVTDLYGHKRTRRVCVGTAHYETLNSAAVMVNTARQTNELPVNAKFEVNL